MTAAAIGLMLAGALALGGAGLARHFRRDRMPVALWAVIALAAIVVSLTDGAALLGFRPWAGIAVVVAVLAGGWLWPGGRPARPESAGGSGCRLRATLLIATACALTVPMLVLPVPLDTDAQGFGYLVHSIRDGGRLGRLMPWHPEIEYLYSPGALLVFSMLSTIVPAASIGDVMFGASHAAAWLFVWLAGDLGREIGLGVADVGHESTSGAPDRWAGAMQLAAALSVGLWTALIDAHYTAIFGLLFGLGFLTAAFRFCRAGHPVDALAAALTLAAVPAAHPDTAVVAGLGLAAYLALGWLTAARSSRVRWLVTSTVVPAAALVLLLPWVVTLRPLLSSISSPFSASGGHWRLLVLYQGVVWPALALLGALALMLERRWWALTMLGWLALVVDVSTVGVVQRLLSGADHLFRFNYPFSLAWHGPIVPCMVLGAAALVAIGDGLRHSRRTMLAVGGVGALVVGLMIFVSPWRAIHGAFATASDVAAMGWLRRHAGPTARVLNYPGDYENGRDWEGHWAPVLAERDCVYFRSQPFFRGLDRPGAGGRQSVAAEQRSLLAFWRDPADPGGEALLRQAGIDYVLVPESLEGSTRSWRWQPPALLRGSKSSPAHAPYLRAVFRTGGAAVYAVGRDG